MRIASIDRRSPAERAGLRAGDELLAVNGAPLRDGLDFTWHTAEERLRFSVRREDGRVEEIDLRRDSRGRLGIGLPQDPVRCCGNRCLFCFIDQNPPGLRPSLYVKDEDYRLSPFHGTYLTLTNLKPWEIERIIEQHLSPLYVSVHAADPQVRARLLGTRPARADVLPLLARLGRGGIRIHTQIVLVPELNDGPVLNDTLEKLEALHPGVLTVAVVPVGLTRHRAGLAPLRLLTAAEAAAAVATIESRAARHRAAHGARLHFAADELYLLAGLPLPPAAAYEGFPQIENGVGLVRVFDRGLRRRRRLISARAGAAAAARRTARGRPGRARPSIAIVTGRLFAPLLGPRLKTAMERTGEAHAFDAQLLAVHNRLFGEEVTVAGLLAGDDIAAAVAAGGPWDLAVLPPAAFNDDVVTLDHRTPGELAARCGCAVQVGWNGTLHPAR